jgi:putative oxidoreductase
MSSDTPAVAHPGSTTSTSHAAPIIFLGRLCFALVFLLGGPRHFLSETISFAASQGVPLANIAVPLSGAMAVIGAILIILGYRAKLGASLIVLFLLGVTPMMHRFWAVSDPMMYRMQFAMFMKNLSMLGGALLITQFGPGSWSLDYRHR